MAFYSQHRGQYDQDPMEVLVVGNSFVRRFGDVDLLGLDSNRHRIHMVGRWRGTNLNLISDINYFIEDILESFRKVDHLILVSGHNDLAEEVFISEYALAQEGHKEGHNRKWIQASNSWQST